MEWRKKNSLTVENYARFKVVCVHLSDVKVMLNMQPNMNALTIYVDCARVLARVQSVIIIAPKTQKAKESQVAVFVCVFANVHVVYVLRQRHMRLPYAILALFMLKWIYRVACWIVSLFENTCSWEFFVRVSGPLTFWADTQKFSRNKNTPDHLSPKYRQSVAKKRTLANLIRRPQTRNHSHKGWISWTHTHKHTSTWAQDVYDYARALESFGPACLIQCWRFFFLRFSNARSRCSIDINKHIQAHIRRHSEMSINSRNVCRSLIIGSIFHLTPIITEQSAYARDGRVF